jgi:hypothetical protein
MIKFLKTENIKNNKALTIFSVFFVLVFISLGFWQIERASEKLNLIKNFESKAFISVQRYMIFITASRILRKFLFLSEAEQSKIVEITIAKLGGIK